MFYDFSYGYFFLNKSHANCPAFSFSCLKQFEIYTRKEDWNPFFQKGFCSDQSFHISVAHFICHSPLSSTPEFMNPCSEIALAFQIPDQIQAELLVCQTLKYISFTANFKY